MNTCKSRIKIGDLEVRKIIADCDLINIKIEAVYCDTCDYIYKNLSIMFDDEFDGNVSDYQVDALSSLIGKLQSIHATWMEGLKND